MPQSTITSASTMTAAPNRVVANVQNLLNDVTVLVERAEQAEFHAYSVRQLIAQRERLFVMFELIAHEAPQFDTSGLQNVTLNVRAAPSQFYQDIFCLILNHGKRNGVFAEIGAYDGLLISNTILLEKQFGWSGILAEPSPRWRKSLQENRSCAVDTRCVWARSGESVRFGDLEGDKLFTQSSITGGGQADNRVFTASYDVQTVSLTDLLDQHQMPPVIDFMSIDVEGCEYDILEGFDFSRYRFEFLAIETHVDKDCQIERLLRQNGYAKILANVSGHDSFFVPADRKSSLPEWV
jgi:FkbM family methyltransferase